MAPPINIPKPKAAPNPRPAPRPPAPKPVPTPAPTQAQKIAWEDARSRAALRLSAFQDQVMARIEGWQKAVRVIGSAYATAAKNHNDALAAQNKIDALKSQIIFSVLTVATSGAFAWVGAGLEAAKAAEDAAKVLQEREWMKAAVQGGAEAGIGEGFSALGPMIFSRENESVSIEPLKFQNDRENAVSEARIKVLERFAAIKLEWSKVPLETWNSYDEKKQRAEFEDLLRQADTMGDADDLPSEDLIAAELERGIWAQWMPKLKSAHYYTTAKDDMKLKVDYEGVGSAIEARFQALGILDLANVTIHVYHSAESEDRKLIAWAQGYKVMDLKSLKQAAKAFHSTWNWVTSHRSG